MFYMGGVNGRMVGGGGAREGSGHGQNVSVVDRVGDLLDYAAPQVLHGQIEGVDITRDAA